ncbi:MAG: class I SAM-dependent methyltransferase [Nitrospinales bacterium]
MRINIQDRFHQNNIPIFLFISIFIGFLIVTSADAKPRDKERWDNNFNEEFYIYGKEPVPFLVDNVNILPKGKALDLAMGEGRNGVYLATQGFDVLGLDISPIGLDKAQMLAEENGVSISTAIADLEEVDLENETYDVILCMYYLQRDLFQKMKDALKSGGMVVVETYNTDYLKYSNFNKKYLLEPNELLEIFKDFKIIKYEMFDDGEEAYSSIIAQKP